MHDDVKAYIDGRDAYNKAHQELQAKYRKACAEARDSFNQRVNELTQPSWDSLKQSSDPLVKWIAENCEDYTNYAVEILKALPAPLSELREIAADADWCDTWDGFVRRAVRDGVIADDHTQEYRELEELIADYHGRGSRAYRLLAEAFKAQQSA